MRAAGGTRTRVSAMARRCAANCATTTKSLRSDSNRQHRPWYGRCCRFESDRRLLVVVAQLAAHRLAMAETRVRVPPAALMSRCRHQSDTPTEPEEVTGWTQECSSS